MTQPVSNKSTTTKIDQVARPLFSTPPSLSVNQDK